MNNYITVWLEPAGSRSMTGTKDKKWPDCDVTSTSSEQQSQLAATSQADTAGRPGTPPVPDSSNGWNSQLQPCDSLMGFALKHWSVYFSNVLLNCMQKDSSSTSSTSQQQPLQPGLVHAVLAAANTHAAAAAAASGTTNTGPCVNSGGGANDANAYDHQQQQPGPSYCPCCRYHSQINYSQQQSFYNAAAAAAAAASFQQRKFHVNDFFPLKSPC